MPKKNLNSKSTSTDIQSDQSASAEEIKKTEEQSQSAEAKREAKNASRRVANMDPDKVAKLRESRLVKNLPPESLKKRKICYQNRSEEAKEKDRQRSLVKNMTPEEHEKEKARGRLKHRKMSQEQRDKKNQKRRDARKLMTESDYERERAQHREKRHRRQVREGKITPLTSVNLSSAAPMNSSISNDNSKQSISNIPESSIQATTPLATPVSPASDSMSRALAIDVPLNVAWFQDPGIIPTFAAKPVLGEEYDGNIYEFTGDDIVLGDVPESQSTTSTTDLSGNVTSQTTSSFFHHQTGPKDKTDFHEDATFNDEHIPKRGMS